MMNYVSSTYHVLNLVEFDPDVNRIRDEDGKIPYEAIAETAENIAEWAVRPGEVISDEELRGSLCDWHDSIQNTIIESTVAMDVASCAETLRRLDAVREGVAAAISKLY